MRVETICKPRIPVDTVGIRRVNEREEAMDKRDIEMVSAVEAAEVCAARVVGELLRRLMARTREGSAAESGLRLAGFDLDALRGRSTRL